MNGDGAADDIFSANEKDGASAFVSIDGEIKGAFRINNVYRKNIQGLIRNLADRYKFSVLSGDHEGEREALEKIFPDNTSMFFNQKPEDKLKYINTLQEKGEDVLMLGDGLNDAGALVKSNTGIAVTEDITSFTPASDAILDADRLSDLDRFLRFSGTSRKIIYLSFIISFLYNIIGKGFAVFGKLTPIIAAILMPASSISVVFFATFAVNTMAKIRKLI
jgi:Cu+-exporting ATPase